MIKTSDWPILQCFADNKGAYKVAYNVIICILCRLRHSDAVNMQFFIQLDKHNDALPSAELLDTSSTRGTSALWAQGRTAGSMCTL